jgi:hypothetical protein
MVAREPPPGGGSKVQALRGTTIAIPGDRALRWTMRALTKLLRRNPSVKFPGCQQGATLAGVADQGLACLPSVEASNDPNKSPLCSN